MKPKDLLTPEELDYYENLNRYQKSAYTKGRKYSDDERREWSSKGGRVKVPKGFSKNKELAREMGRRLRKERENE